MIPDIAKKVIITGINGFIGSHLANHLLSSGHEVFGIGRASAPTSDFVKPLASYVAMDLGDVAQIQSLPKADCIVHAAYDKTNGAQQKNCEGTYELMKLAREAGIKQQILFSSISAIQGSSEYAKIKYKLESMAHSFAATIVRPGLVTGSGGLYRKIESAALFWPLLPIVGQGQQNVYLISIHNLNTCIERLIVREMSGTWNLFESQPIPMKTLLTTIKTQNRNGKPIFVSIPEWIVRGLIRLSELLPSLPLPFDGNNLKGLLQNANLTIVSDMALLFDGT